MLFLVIIVIFHSFFFFQFQSITAPHLWHLMLTSSLEEKVGAMVGVKQCSCFRDEKSEAPRCIEFSYCAHSTVWCTGGTYGA